MSRGDAQAAAAARFFRPTPPTLIRYVLRELAAPTLMGFGVFTFLLLMDFLLQLAERMIRDRLPLIDVGRFFLYSVPHIVVLTLPMAVLVGGLVGFGRLSSDSEIIAMRSGGISLYQLAVPILLLASGATLLNLYLCLQVLPWGNSAILELQNELYNARTLSAEVRPRVFETRFPGYTVFVEDVVGPEGEWRRLFLADHSESSPRVVMAQSAAATVDEETDALWLELREGYIYEGGQTPEESSVARFVGQEELIMTGAHLQGAATKDDRSMSIAELEEAISVREAQGLPTAGFRVEIQKRFSIPMACLILGLIAVPLGISTQRHTKATGYLTAIAVIAVYYVFIENGEKFAEEGAIPVWLGMWAANIVLGAAALFLLWSKAGEKDFGVFDTLMRGLDWVRGRCRELWRRLRDEPAAGAERAGPAEAGGRPAGRGFPRILDRYVLAQFVRIFALTLAGLIVVWMIIEYFEISDDVYSSGASRWVIAEFFQFRMPFIVMMALPIATTLTVLIVFSLMSKHNEVIAVLAGGTSLFRLAAPVLVPVVALAVTQYALSDYIVPHTNLRLAGVQEKLELTNPNAGPLAQARWVWGKGRHLFNFADYDPETSTFQGLCVYYVDDAHWRLGRVECSARVQWQEGAWVATDSWRRHYLYEGEAMTSPALMRFPSGALPIEEGPEYFGTEQRLPDQMSAAQLRQHIADLEGRGFDGSKYRIDLQQKLAFPAIVFVMALVGIPFGFRMGRQGTLSGVAVGLTLVVVFWLAFVLFRAIGAAGMLPPVVAAWAPHALFLALAGYITLGLRT
jgi:LPS export ABC transporter permease LptF/LPS export ABC transporter permease LptG